MQGGILYSRGRIVIPPSVAALILTIMQLYPDSPMAGHYGVRRTQALVQQYFWWSGLATAVDSYVWSCDVCHGKRRCGMRRSGC